MLARTLRPLTARRGDRVAMAVLLIVPVLVFAVPAVAGRLVVPGDDLVQNLPLRELVGYDLRHAHFPTLDPYVWSGEPLLGGWNAGAAYPLTWLFAIVPGGAAWTVGLVVTWWVAGTGVYVLVRTTPASTIAAFVAAFSFVFGGAMTAQLSHVGLVEGFSWVPWELVAIRYLTGPTGGRRRRLAVAAVLALLLALTVLAGEPRAVADAAVVLVVYVPWRLARIGRGWRLAASRLAWLAGAGLLAAAMSAVQWLPGLDALADSQRAAGSYALFAYESLPKRWIGLLFVPDLLGGSGSFGAATFRGGINLAEVTAYAGLAPLGAAVGLLGRLRRRHPLPEWVVWELVLALGLLLALGASTPLGHLLAAVPLYGQQRIQARNLVELDLALSLLAGAWVDGFVHGRELRSGSTMRRAAPRLLAALPGLVATALATWGLVSPHTLLDTLAGPGAAAGGGYRDALLPSLALGLGWVALVLAWPARRRRAPLLVSFVVVDLLVLAVTTVVAVGSPSNGAGQVASGQRDEPVVTAGVTPVAGAGGATLRVDGRFAIYDPTLADLAAINRIGQPDLNLTAGGYAVGGYGALVDAAYARATGSHATISGGQDTLAPRAISGTALDQLGTSVLLAPADALVSPAVGSSRPGTSTAAPGSGAAVTGTASTAGPAATPATRHLARGRHSSVSWYLGPPVSVAAVSMAISPSPAGTAVTLGVVGPSGHVESHRVAVSAGRASWTLPAPMAAVAVVAGDEGAPRRSLDGTSTAAAPEVTELAGDGRYDVVVLDGPLQGALTVPHWRYQRTDGPLAVYADTRRAPGAYLAALPGTSPSALRGAKLHVLAGPAVAPTRVQVSTPDGATVVRAVAALPGWDAVWRPYGVGEAPSILPVRRHGLVQAVEVPPGGGTLTWRYVAPGFTAGLTLSLVALGALAAAVAVVLATRTRRRPS